MLSFSGARAEVVVTVSKSQQQVSVTVDGVQRHRWPVSTGRAGFTTPNGSFRAQRLERSWFSRRYDNAPMPHSVFFYEGYALHGTTHVGRLGNVASHGCVRLHPAHAATLFALIRREGLDATRVVVSDAALPSSATRMTDRKPPSASGKTADKRPVRAKRVSRVASGNGFGW